MKYFRIKNWEKYQHPDTLRSKHGMPWIKLHTSLLDDHKMFGLTPVQRLTWVLLLLNASRTRNKLAYNPAFLKHELNLKHTVDLALFESLGLIEVFDASKDASMLQAQTRLEERRSANAGVDLKSSHEQAEKNKRKLEELMEKIGSV